MIGLRLSSVLAILLLAAAPVAEAQDAHGGTSASGGQTAQGATGQAAQGATGANGQAAPGASGQAQGANSQATQGAGDQASSQSDEARQDFLRGQSAYQQGDYDTAIHQWESAYHLDPRPLIEFNLSQAYERLGRAEDAIKALEKYIDTANPTDPYMADARARLASLHERVAHTGVKIAGAPAGSAIRVDGHDWGVTPRPDPVPVSPGSHQVVLSHAGYEDFHEAMSVTAGQVIDVHVQMQHAAAPPAPGRSPWPYVIMGAGGAFAVVALIVGGVASGAADKAPTSDGTAAQSARAGAGIADVMGITSLVIIAGGFVWWLLDAPKHPSPHHHHTTASLELAPYVSPNGGGAVAVGRF